MVEAQARHQTGRRFDWVMLYLWLLRQAEARAVFTETEYATKLAYVILDVRRAYPDLATLLPPADEAVRACLDAIPVGLDDVALLDDRRDLRSLDPTGMCQSRQARNLVSAAEWHLEHIEDDALADRLRAWLAIKPRLV